MNMTKSMLIGVIAVCFTIICWLLNKGLPTQDMQILKDKELKLEQNIQMLYSIICIKERNKIVPEVMIGMIVRELKKTVCLRVLVFN